MKRPGKRGGGNSSSDRISVTDMTYDLCLAHWSRYRIGGFGRRPNLENDKSLLVCAIRTGSVTTSTCRSRSRSPSPLGTTTESIQINTLAVLQVYGTIGTSHEPLRNRPTWHYLLHLRIAKAEGISTSIYCQNGMVNGCWLAGGRGRLPSRKSKKNRERKKEEKDGGDQRSCTSTGRLLDGLACSGLIYLFLCINNGTEW